MELRSNGVPTCKRRCLQLGERSAICFNRSCYWTRLRFRNRVSRANSPTATLSLQSSQPYPKQMEIASLTAPALGLLFCCLVAVFLLPRHLAVAPVLAATVLMTIGQSIEIGGAHFYFLRIVILATWLRVIVRREYTSLSFNSLDKAFLIWGGFSILVAFIPKPIHPDAVQPPASFASTLVHQGGLSWMLWGAIFWPDIWSGIPMR